MAVTTKLPEKPRSALASLLNKFVGLTIVLALGFFGYRYLATDQLNEQIRQRVEAKFRLHYAGLHVQVESARRVEGQGIEIRGLTIAEVDRLDNPVLYVDRILAECDTALPEFITKPPVIRAILVQRARVHAVRRRNGFWNYRHLFPLPVATATMPPLRVEGATVAVLDESREGVDPLELREIRLAFHCDPTAAESLGLPTERAGDAIRMEGEMAGDHFREIRMEGILDRRAECWNLRGAVDDLQFTPSLRNALPRDLAEQLSPVAAMSGSTHFQFQVDNVALPEKQLHFAVAGTIAGGRIDDARLPLPLTEVAAKVIGDNAGFQIENLRARLGDAELEASLRLDGFETTSPLVLRLGAKNLSLNEDLVESLPEDVRPLWRQLGLTAKLNGQLTLQYDGRNWTPEFECDLSRVSLQYEKFPYRLTEGEAKVCLHGDRLTVQGKASAGNSRVRCSAEIRDPGPEWHGWAEARTEEPAPIDDRLLNALTPAARSVVQSFHASGSVQLLGRIDRKPGAARNSHFHLEVAMHDCSINYEKFSYPIDHIHGTLRNTDGAWSFVDLKGTQGTAQINCSGSFAPDGDRGPLLALEFHNTNVALNDTLRQALSFENQRIWDDFRPRGELDVLGVKVLYRPREKLFDLEVSGGKLLAHDSRPRPIRVEPVWFPYALDITSGSVQYRDGVLQLQRIRALHDRTKLEADGTFRWNSAGKWSLAIPKMNADRLQLDHDLLAALPADVGRALAKAKFVGSMGMTGGFQIGGMAGDTAAMNADWKLVFDVEDGRLAGDVPVEHIHGGVELIGGVDNGRWASQGEVRLDSAFFHDMQFTQIRGPFRVNQKQLLLGSWAERDSTTGTPRQFLAQVFDGLLAADASVSLEDNGEFQLECTLEQASLAKIAQEAHLPADDIAGKAFGVLQVTGTTRGKHTWRGGGNVRLRDAYLYKVPAMVSLLKLLSIRTPDSTAFTTSDVDFRIQGDDLIFDRMDLGGDAISLKGRGRLYEQKQIDVLFYTQMGRHEAQPRMLRPLLAEAGPYFLLIEVTGSIDHPQMKKTAFPALNETLRELFPDLSRERDPQESSAGAVSGLRGLLPKTSGFQR